RRGKSCCAGRKNNSAGRRADSKQKAVGRKEAHGPQSVGFSRFLVPKLRFGNGLFRNSVSVSPCGRAKRRFADTPFPNRSLGTRKMFGNALFRNSVSVSPCGRAKRRFADTPFPNRSLGTRNTSPKRQRRDGVSRRWRFGLVFPLATAG